jgi:protein-arginine kinase
MFKYFLFSLLVLLFSACSSNKALTHFNKDEFFSKALQFSKKCDIVYQNEVQLMLSASYLDPIYEFDEANKKHFLVGIYNAKQTNEDNVVLTLLKNNQMNFKLNENDYIHIQAIDKQSQWHGALPLFNAWADYFMITFEQNDQANFLQTLTFEYEGFEPCLLSFEESY